MFTRTEKMVIFIVACVVVFLVWLQYRTNCFSRFIEWFLSKDPERIAFEEEERKKKAEKDAARSKNIDTK
jgi:hypothetical protein